MKNLAKASYHFSAYPLKAYKGYSDEKSVKSTLRIFPMKIPNIHPQRIFPLEGNLVPSDIELTDKSWFKQYE